MVVGKVNLLQTTNTQLMVFKHSSPQHGCFNVPSLHLLQDPSSPSMCECCFKVATSYTSSIKSIHIYKIHATIVDPTTEVSVMLSDNTVHKIIGFHVMH
ncbi:unnamed protein product [Lactuca virosa]|uniref:Uncharacterized protein n=1 Tax=Lactuca virosa TaxID=75947 RepID=A0AAU9LFI5_9ASTR|nr:unnamed protein product [Lactuca virosa]